MSYKTKSFKSPCVSVMLIIIVVFLADSISQAKSVYVVNHQKDSMIAYSIDDGQIEFQANLTLPENGYGPIDVAVDPASDILLVSNEQGFDNTGGNVIELVDARKLQRIGTITLTHSDHPDNIAGIVVDNNDPNQPRVYLTDRNTNNLFTYLWDPNELTLILEPNSLDNVPNPKTLTNITSGRYACGIDLDEPNGVLYVSEFYYDDIEYTYHEYSNKVHTYDRDDGWEHLQTYTLEDNVVAIAYDSTTQRICGGTFSDHTKLIQYGINDENPHSSINIGHSVNAVDIDEESGYVYITTGSGKVQSWKYYNFFLGWYQCDVESRGLSGPAGICVGQAEFLPPFYIEKEDDLSQNQCVIREDEITYTICYDYQWTDDGDPELNEFTSITIVDYLPQEVDFVSADPNTGVYDDPPEHTYTWTIDANSIGDPNCLELTVKISKMVTPGEAIENSVVEIISFMEDQEYIGKDTTETTACDCSEFGTILRVDKDVSVADPNGLSWETAFDDLTDALNAAWPCDQIWVAEGTYTPEITSEPNMYFDIPRYVTLLGGFWGDEEESYERNWADPNKETILSGDEDLDYVVNIDVEQALVDGFTIKDGSLAGVYCENGTVVLEHNKITSNEKGIYCNDTENSIIRNNLIYGNQYGIYLKNTVETKIVNNTLVDNSSAGIYSEASIDPYISNCIIWDDAEINDVVDCNAIYSCLTDGTAGQGNIDGDPNYPPFVIGDDYYHLDPCSGPGSACIDAGDPFSNYSGQSDIDKHVRILDGDGDGEEIVDMGADEYCNQGTNNVADFNDDDIVDTTDLCELAGLWLADPNDPGWNIKYDLYSDDVIDYRDFAYFVQEWMWMTCDKMLGYEMMEMMMGMGEGMGRMMGIESMLMSKQKTESQQSYSEPSIEEQIEQIKQTIAVLYEVKDQVEDEKACLGIIASFEEMLKELEDSQ